jgi:hypothetical protein
MKRTFAVLAILLIAILCYALERDRSQRRLSALGLSIGLVARNERVKCSNSRSSIACAACLRSNATKISFYTLRRHCPPRPPRPPRPAGAGSGSARATISTALATRTATAMYCRPALV